MLDGVVLSRKTGAGAIKRPVLVALGLRPDGKKATKMLRKSWKRWAPQRNSIALKNIGVKVHPSAAKAFNEMGS